MRLDHPVWGMRWMRALFLMQESGLAWFTNYYCIQSYAA